MDSNADLPESYDYRDTDTVYPMTLFSSLVGRRSCAQTQYIAHPRF